MQELKITNIEEPTLALLIQLLNKPILPDDDITTINAKKAFNDNLINDYENPLLTRRMIIDRLINNFNPCEARLKIYNMVKFNISMKDPKYIDQ